MKFDKQKIFNKVTRHLIKQGVQATDKGRSCQYRGLGGTSCALGCLIPDALYDENIEGCAITGSILIFDGTAYEPGSTDPTEDDGKFRKIMETATGAKTLADFRLLADLQSIHDGYSEEWYGKLKELAKKRRLKFPRVAAAKKVKA